MLDTDLLTKITQWKARWGIIHITTAAHEPNVDTCIYRGLSALESTYLRGLMESNKDDKTKDWDSIIVSIGLLYPTIDKISLPGTINVLSTNILSVSNPTEESLPDLVSNARSWAKVSIENSYSVSLCLAICNLYPSISLIELLNLPLEKLMQLGALVEVVTQKDIFQNKTPNSKSGVKVAPLKPGVAESMKSQLQQINTTSASLKDEIDRARTKKKGIKP